MLIIALVATVLALGIVLTGAHRSIVCAEATVVTALPAAGFGGNARVVIQRNSCPWWALLADRWIATLQYDGRTDELLRTFGRPWPGRVEAKGEGGSRRLLIHMEPRSLDGTAGIVEIAIGANGRPVLRR